MTVEIATLRALTRVAETPAFAQLVEEERRKARQRDARPDDHPAWSRALKELLYALSRT